MNAITERDRRMAEQCGRCPVCRQARARQRGFFFWLVKRVERALCPYCRAYERVYGRPAHAVVPSTDPSGIGN